MSGTHSVLWLIPLGPALLGACAGLVAIARRVGALGSLLDRVEPLTPMFTIAATLASGAVALGAAPGAGGQAVAAQQVTWLSLPPHFIITLGVHLDQLAWLMVLVVCCVSLLVQIYSIGYMAGEQGYARYFAYLGFFTASMLGLVVADNLFQLYVCWELVGICSYLLIGFWWQKRAAANAAKKAFVVNRFGDVGFMLGVLLVSSVAGSFQFSAAERAVSAIAHGQPLAIPLFSASTFLWLAPVLLFCGAIGKSAQFPLHVWLPDAMEGPTPVSALIHAATMVAAGVYMVARLFPIFAASGVAMDVVLLIGAVTALLAATIALVQTDIKKVMAYSTVSQLGYMMLGLGAGGRMAGVFHLTTHAMFKALLFLTAGSVIHALHHSAEPNELRGMGGLLKRMPITAWTCLAGVLALAGFPGLSGFWSKDAILGAALEAGRANPIAIFALLVGIMVAGLTAFYSLRMWLMAFWGEPRSEEAEHALESPLTMTAPLVLLAIPSIGLGWWLHAGGRFGHMVGWEAGEAASIPLMAVTTLVALAGMAAAIALYAKPKLAADPVERVPAYRALVNLWYVDAFWNRVGAQGTLAVGRAIAWTDRNVIDRYVANGPGWLCARASEQLRRTTSGQAQSYAAAFLAAIVMMVAMLAWYQGRLAPGHARYVLNRPPMVAPLTATAAREVTR